MGALTSKPYAFRVRPWELQAHYTYDVFEFFSTPIKLEYRKDFLYRVLPNPDSLFRWISDLTRFNLPVIIRITSSYFFYSIKLKHYLISLFSLFSNFEQIIFNFVISRSVSLLANEMFNTPSLKSLQNFSNEIFFFKTFVTFFNFNLRQFSPTFLASFKNFIKSCTFCFFGPFYDLALPTFSTNYSFPATEFLKVYYLRSSKYSLQINLKNSMIFRPLFKYTFFPNTDFFAFSTFIFSTFFNIKCFVSDNLLSSMPKIISNYTRFSRFSTNIYASSQANFQIFSSFSPLTIYTSVSDIFFFNPMETFYNFPQKTTAKSFFFNKFALSNISLSSMFIKVMFFFYSNFEFESVQSFPSKYFFLSTKYTQLYTTRVQKFRTSFLLVFLTMLFRINTFSIMQKKLFYLILAVYFFFLPFISPYIHSSFILTANFLVLLVIFGISNSFLGALIRHPFKFFVFLFFSPKTEYKLQNFFVITAISRKPLYKYIFTLFKYYYLSAFLATFIVQPYAYAFSSYYAYTHFLDETPVAIFAYIIQFFAWTPFFITFVTLPDLYDLYTIGYFLPVQILLIDFFRSLATILPLLLGVAFLTLYERKVLAAVQLRRGPDLTGFIGLLQPIADGFKLLFKELIVPLSANKTVFIFAPILTFFFGFFGVLMFPFYTFDVVFDFELSIMLFFGLSSIGIFGIILSGWASNSRYAFLGSLRSTAQIISYEVSLGLTLQTVCLPASSLAFFDIVQYQTVNGWFIFPFFFSFILFLISTLAEVNRPPFDLPEAEAELVSGYNVEYSSSTFALFFIGEYANVIVTSLVSVFFFLGGSGTGLFAPIVLAFKLFAFLSFFILIRAALPRFRYDQLITFGWKGILPISFGWFVFSTTIFYALHALFFAPPTFAISV